MRFGSPRCSGPSGSSIVTVPFEMPMRLMVIGLAGPSRSASCACSFTRPATFHPEAPRLKARRGSLMRISSITAAPEIRSHTLYLRPTSLAAKMVWRPCVSVTPSISIPVNRLPSSR